MVGCCIHVAAILYYLGYAKNKIAENPENIKIPGTHLNSIFVDTSQSVNANSPEYVRHRRRKNVLHESESIISNNSSEISFKNKTKINDLKSKKQFSNHIAMILMNSNQLNFPY